MVRIVGRVLDSITSFVEFNYNFFAVNLEDTFINIQLDNGELLNPSKRREHQIKYSHSSKSSNF